MSPQWLPPILVCIRTHAEAGRVRFTYKALRELAGLGFGLDEDDACDILASVAAEEFFERIVSEHTGEWMYVFKPVVGATTLYLKIIIRDGCVIISLHKDEVSDEHEGQ